MKTTKILEYIRDCCGDIRAVIKCLINDRAIFDTDREYCNFICMNLLQIGELTEHMTKMFCQETKETIHRYTIGGMMNLFSHTYRAANIDRVWETEIVDMPKF